MYCIVKRPNNEISSPFESHLLHVHVHVILEGIFKFSLPPCLSLSPSLSSIISTDQFPLISDDLVNSHYLLLCCIDMLCAAAVIGKRHDLLRNDFTPPSLPAVTPDCDSAPLLIIDDYPTILPELCRQFSGLDLMIINLFKFYS